MGFGMNTVCEVPMCEECVKGPNSINVCETCSENWVLEEESVSGSVYCVPAEPDEEITNLLNEQLPDEASPLLCSNRMDMCKTCSTHDDFYCIECNEGFEFRSVDNY